MSIAKISIVLVVTIVSMHCTPSWDAAAVTSKPTYLDLSSPNTHAALSAELLDVVKKFQATTTSPEMSSSATTPAPVSPSSNRISVMHFPALDQSTRSSDKSVASSLVPGVVHPQSLALNLHVPDNQMIEKPSSLALPVGGGHAANNALPSSVPPPAATDETAVHHLSSPPAELQATPPEKQPLVVGLPPKFNLQDLQKLLTDLRMTPAVTPQIPLAPAPTPVPETPPKSSSSSISHPPEDSLPMLKPNQSPLDYLLSPSSPIKITSNPPSGSSNTSTSTKPRPNLEFVKYLLTLPRYQQALMDLIKTQS